MKIMHVAQFLGIGGLEKVLHLLIQEQIKSGHQVQLIVYDYERAWVEMFRSEGITVHTDYTKALGYDKKLLNYLQDKISGFDVIHTHDLNPMMYLGPLKFISKTKFKKFPKLVHTTHGMEHIDQEPKTRVYEKLISMMADKVVGVSPAICKYYQKNLKTKSSKVFNIDNGTFVPELLPEYANASMKEIVCKQFDLDPSKNIWVYVARVVPLKDQKILINAFSKLSNEQLLLIGPSGNDKYWNELQDLLPPNIKMPGGMRNINEILSGSNFYISSSHHEGIPISVLEAGAQGLPCLLSDIPGHRTLAESSKVKPIEFFTMNDSKSLEEKIQILLTDDNLVQTLRQNLHKVVYENYSARRMFDSYMKVYQE